VCFISGENEYFQNLVASHTLGDNFGNKYECKIELKNIAVNAVFKLCSRHVYRLPVPLSLPLAISLLVAGFEHIAQREF
jgi:hypothetical protein